MKRTFLVMLVAGVLILGSGLAFGKDRGYTTSLTVSPIHLLFPVVEATGEFLVDKQTSLAIIGAAGSVTVEEASGEQRSFTTFELGGQIRYYALGGFEHGMQIGAEVLYAYVDAAEKDNISGTGAGLAAGPFLGYKIATHIGFTFDAQLGVQYIMAKANAENDETNETATASDSAISPMLNLNVGWSF